MKSITAAVLSMIIFLSIASPAIAAENVSIDASSVIRSGVPSPVGINLDYLLDDDAGLPTGGVPLTQALEDMSVKYLRYPGGEKADNYLWTVDASGQPVTTSSAIPSPLQPTLVDKTDWPGNDLRLATASGTLHVNPLDFDEYMTTCAAINCEPVIVVAYDNAREFTGNSQSPTKAQLIASAAAWVKYANITKGYDIKYWSVGNESWFRSGQTVTKYIADVNQFATAMRAVDPSIKILAHGNSASWYDAIANNANTFVDVLDIHDYPIYNYSNGYSSYGSKSNQAAEVDRAILATKNYAPAMKVMVTETNALDWNYEFGKTGWANVNDVGHALALFDMQGQYMSRPEVAAYQIWNTEYIGNLAYVATTTTNFINNGGFESGLVDWSVASGIATTSTSTKRSGSYALKVGATTGSSVVLGTTTPITAGMSGHLAFWAAASSLSAYSGVGIDFLDAAGDEVDGKSIELSNVGWRKYDMNFQAPATAVAMRIWISSVSAIVHLDDFIVDDGQIPGVFNALTPTNTLQPIGQSIALWGQFMEDTFLRSTSTSKVKVWAAKSSTSSDMTVWLLNKATKSSTATLTLNNYSPESTIERWIFKGTTPTDFLPTTTQASNVAIGGNVLSISLNPASVTVLKMKHVTETPPPPPTPTISFSASATTSPSGISNLLTWSSENATNCVASGAWSGSKALSGTQMINPTATSTYTLNCGAPTVGTSTQAVTINVTPNLVSNPSFENGMTSWANWSGATSVVSGTGVTGNAARTGTATGGIGQDIFSKVTIGNTYNLTAYAKVGSSADTEAYVGIKAANSSGVDISSVALPVTSTTYQPYSMNYTIPVGAKKVYVWTWKDSTSGGTYLYTDDIVVK